MTIGGFAVTKFLTWGDETRTRRREAEKHRAAVIDSLKRIEDAIAKSNHAAR